MTRRSCVAVVAAWALAGAMLLLLAASLTGDGDGLPGLGIASDPAFAWLVVLVAGSVALAVLLSRQPAPAPQEVPAHGKH